MTKQGLVSEHQLWEKDDAIELRLWASYRGQTLARTVRGMMYYERCEIQKHQVLLIQAMTNCHSGCILAFNYKPSDS